MKSQSCLEVAWMTRCILLLWSELPSHKENRISFQWWKWRISLLVNNRQRKVFRYIMYALIFAVNIKNTAYGTFGSNVLKGVQWFIRHFRLTRDFHRKEKMAYNLLTYFLQACDSIPLLHVRLERTKKLKGWIDDCIPLLPEKVNPNYKLKAFSHQNQTRKSKIVELFDLYVCVWLYCVWIYFWFYFNKDKNI